MAFEQLPQFGNTHLDDPTLARDDIPCGRRFGRHETEMFLAGGLLALELRAAY